MTQSGDELSSAGASEPEPSTPSRQGKRLPLTTLAIEVFSIVLGVLLALGVNEWRQVSANEELATTARTNLFAEIEANQNHLRAVYEGNLAIQEWLAKDTEEGGESLQYTPAWGLQDTAWQVARDTGALQHMSYQAVAGFSSVYGFQQTYRTLVLQLTQSQMFGLQLLKDEPLDIEALNEDIGKRSLPIVELLIVNEKSLLEAYDRALEYRD